VTVATGFAAPIYSHEDLRRRAHEFLATHHPVGTIPIPIEEIVEFQLGIDIVPMPGLDRLIETDGFITSDLQEVYVDEFVYAWWTSAERPTARRTSRISCGKWTGISLGCRR
jgi:hypothetical protein